MDVLLLARRRHYVGIGEGEVMGLEMECFGLLHTYYVLSNSYRILGLSALLVYCLRGLRDSVLSRRV